MKLKTYLFIYGRIDGSCFNVVDRLANDEVAIESAKIALSKHDDIRSVNISVCADLWEFDKAKL